MLHYVLAGILLGLLAGLMPGIHTNTIAGLLANLPLDQSALPFLIMAMAGAHVVFEIIPAIFLYIPDSDAVLTLLPGHRMLLEGKAMRALGICALSFITSSFASLLLLPLSLSYFPAIYSLVQPNIFVLLALVSILLIASERKAGGMLLASIVFALSGALGQILFNSPVVAEPLFPSFAGMFALSSLLLSSSSPKTIPKQREQKIPLSILPYALLGTILGALSDLLPGLSSPAQVAALASVFIGFSSEGFLAIASAVSTSHLVLSLSALSSIGKARTGATAIAGSLLPSLSANDVFALAAAVVFSIAVSSLALVALGRKASAIIPKMNTKALNALVFAYLVLMILITSGPQGLLAASVATAIGLLPPLLGVRRTHLMGLILLPSLIRYSGLA